MNLPLFYDVLIKFSARSQGLVPIPKEPKYNQQMKTAIGYYPRQHLGKIAVNILPCNTFNRGGMARIFGSKNLAPVIHNLTDIYYAGIDWTDRHPHGHDTPNKESVNSTAGKPKLVNFE